MKKCKMKILVLLAILIVSLLISLNYTNAATTGSFSISSTSQELTTGGTATLTISVTNCEGKFVITSSDSNVVSVGSTEKFIPVDGNTIVLTAKSVGTATITVTAENVADNQSEPEDVEGSKTITITVKAPAPTPTPTETKPATTTTDTTYSDVNETVYLTASDVLIRKSAINGDKIGTVSKATKLTRTGVGSNGWSRVTYNGQTGYIRSDFLSTSAPTGSSVSTLKSLSVSTGNLSPAFATGTTSYSMTVDKSVESVTVSATATDSKATVKGTGKITLKDGTNQVKIVVTAENGTTSTYKINISKLLEETTPGNLLEGMEKLQLTSLVLDGVTISPEFNAEVFSYTATIKDEKMTELKIIESVANQTDAKVEIVGNTNLQVGENIVTIILTSADGVQTVTYQIIINKEGGEKTEEVANNVAGITNETNLIDKVVALPLKSKLIVAGIILVTIVLIIVLIVKYVKDKKETDDELDFKNPGNNFDEDEEFSFDREYTKEDFMKNFGENKQNDFNDNFEEQSNFAEDEIENDFIKPQESISDDTIEIENVQQPEEVKKEPEFTTDDLYEDDIYSSINKQFSDDLNEGIFDDDVRYGMRKNKRNTGRGKGRHF